MNFNKYLIKLIFDYYSLQKCVDELYDLRDHYFVKNGVEKASERTKEIGEKMTEVKECLDRLLGMYFSQFEVQLF